MLDVEDWAEIRRLYRAGVMLIKVNLRELGVLEECSKKALAADGPPAGVPGLSAPRRAAWASNPDRRAACLTDCWLIA